MNIIFLEEKRISKKLSKNSSMDKSATQSRIIAPKHETFRVKAQLFHIFQLERLYLEGLETTGRIRLPQSVTIIPAWANM